MRRGLTLSSTNQTLYDVYMEPMKNMADIKEKIHFSDQDVMDVFAGKLPTNILQTIDSLLEEKIACDFPVLAKDDWKIVLNVRPNVEPTRPESHRNWHDASVYITGSNSIALGTHLRDATEKEPGNGEWRGGIIQGKYTIALSAKDLLFVPAGVPHQNELSPDTSFFVLKIKKGAEQNSPLTAGMTHWEKSIHIPGYCKA